MDHEVQFLPSGRRVTVPAGTTLLEAARRAGLPVASACGADGICARCGLEIVQGDEALAPESDREREIKSANRVAPGLRLSCRVELQSDLVVTAPYW